MNKKILSVVEMISNEKSLPREKIFEALETALSIATKTKYNQEINVRVRINRKNGHVNTFRRWMVVKKIQYPTKEIILSTARLENKLIQLGEFIEDKISSIEFDRITIQLVKQIILKKVQDATRSIAVNTFYNYKGKIIKGTVKKIDRNFIILKVNDYVQAILNKDNMLPREYCKIGDRISGILYDIRHNMNNIQLFISRVKLEMLTELFHIEVPEIKEKIIEIKALAREPGFRSKIAVISHDQRIDPIGACIGVQGSRIQSVSKELNGEKIDIILWNKNPAQFIMNILAPINIISIVIHEDKHIMDIAVYAQQLSKAIGRYGRNIQLASKLSKWNLNIMTIEDFYSKNKIVENNLQNLFIKKFNIQLRIVNILLKEGLLSVEKLICTSYSQLIKINSLDKKIIYYLKDQLKQYFSNILIQKTKNIFQNKDNILSILKINQKTILYFMQKNIFNIEDLANQGVNDIHKFNSITYNNLKCLIISARNICWFNKK